MRFADTVSLFTCLMIVFVVDENDCMSSKLNGDLAYATRDYRAALKYYNEYLSRSSSVTGGAMRDVLEGVIRCNMVLGCQDDARECLDKLMIIGHAQNVLKLR